MLEDEPLEGIETGRQNIVVGKRYMVFTGSEYYPLGAIDDLALMTDDESEVREIIDRIKKQRDYVLDWYSVYDTETGDMQDGNYGDDDWVH